MVMWEFHVQNFLSGNSLLLNPFQVKEHLTRIWNLTRVRNGQKLAKTNSWPEAWPVCCWPNAKQANGAIPFCIDMAAMP